MKHTKLTAAALIAFASPILAPLAAQEEAPEKAEAAPSPNEIVNEAPDGDWVQIAAEDLLVMTLAPDAQGNAREVVIQLMPAPFSQGWVENIRTLARAKWYDGISVNRVQDNYVVQWGDPGHDNPEGEGTETKALPEGLNVMSEEDYTSSILVEEDSPDGQKTYGAANVTALIAGGFDIQDILDMAENEQFAQAEIAKADRYSDFAGIAQGWPFANQDHRYWPIHCYGMVGVGRGFSPDAGSGAELYTVIGHAPRHLDRNIALAGRIISGMEHLSSLPRGSGVLGFYTQEEANKRTPIRSIRVASDLPESDRPQFEYLDTSSEAFGRYALARANRRDPFFIVPAGGADICNIPVPIRVVSNE